MKGRTEGCYCARDEGGGYTYHDEHGNCDYCEEFIREANTLFSVWVSISCVKLWSMLNKPPNADGAKFKVGDVVLFGGVGTTVLGSNRVDEVSVEYAVAGWPYLVWEDELREV